MSDNNPSSLADLQGSLSVAQQLQRSSMVSVLLMLLGITVIAGSLYYSITRLEPLERQIAEKRETLKELENKIKEKEASLAQLEKKDREKQKYIGVISTSIGVPVESASTAAFEKRGKTTIEYFLKDVDQRKVLGAIQDLGFKVKPISPIGNTPTNAIWFGSKVDVEDVKLVAYALVHAGVNIKDIRPFAISEGREDVIQIGGRPAAVGKTSLTVEQIRAVRQFTR
jgi:hypothetical protein